jgi:HPt (histidine-containing phosphotransfer) domain-containing protein
VAADGSGGGVDFSYLEGFAAGDRAVVDEVLSMFREQAQAWLGALDAGDPAWRDTVHTIKGTARGIGAFALGDACARAEAEGGSRLGEVTAALHAAVAEIAAYQVRDQA